MPHAVQQMEQKRKGPAEQEGKAQGIFEKSQG
jgi:hypothetical protein